MTERKIVAFDAVRGLAALAVVFYHLTLAFLPGLYAARLNPFFHVVVEGAFHVRVFFVLSGFVLSLSYFRAPRLDILRSLAIRRYFRFLIPVAASVFLAYVLMIAGLYFNEQCGSLLGQPPNYWFRIYNRFQPSFLEACKQSVWTAYFGGTGLDSYNNVLWTMAVELKGSYLVFGFLALFGELRYRWLAYILFILILHWTLGDLGGLYGCFLAGVGFCDLYVIGYTTKGVTAFVLVLTGLFFGGLTPGWLAIRGYSMSVMSYGDCLSIGAALLIAGVAASSDVRRFLTGRPLVFLGKVSFPLYLVHLPMLFSVGAGVYCLLHTRVGRLGAVGAASATTLSASLLLAWIGSLTLEPLAIWSGRLIEGWMGHPDARPEIVHRVTVEMEARGDLVRPAENPLIESPRTENGGA